MGSSAPKRIRASTARPGSQPTTSRTKTKGGRWGRPRNGSEDGEFRLEDGDSFKKLSSILHPQSSLQASSIHEVNELPAALHSRDSDAVAVVVESRIGELGRRD